MAKVIALLPIEVPDGKYCWEYTGERSICENFDNEGGHATCELGLGSLKESTDGVLKGKRCAVLEIRRTMLAPDLRESGQN